MHVRFPLSLRNVEDLLFEHGIDIYHETARLWWNRFGSLFAGDIAACGEERLIAALSAVQSTPACSDVDEYRR